MSLLKLNPRSGGKLFVGRSGPDFACRRYMQNKILFSIALSACFAAGCYTSMPGPKPEPIIPADISRYPRAIVVTSMPPIDDPVTQEDFLLNVEKQIRFVLDSSGFRVVSPSEYEEIWFRVINQVGGLFDPITGEQVPAKYRAARRELFRELRGRYGAELIMYLDVDFPMAEMWNGFARWDGVAARVPGAYWDMIFGSGTSGSVEAISLVASLETEKEGRVWEGRGGLTVLETRRGAEWNRVDSLDVTQEAIDGAVRAAIGPLILAPVPPDSTLSR